MMSRIAFVFPGQGAQEVGMGRDLLGSSAFADGLFELASEATGEDIAGLCSRGPARRLAETRLLQPALTSVCLGYWKQLVDAGISPAATAGHSLGELPALAASGAADPADAVALAAARGRAMSEAAALRPGSMIAVTGAPVEDVMALAKAFDGEGVVAAAAVNAPNQLTVSGDPGALEIFCSRLGGVGDARITPLRVSGAWHSEHMRPAVEPFGAALARTGLRPPAVPMVFNRHGATADDPARIRELLSGQLVSPVRWDLVMARLVELGITDYVEIGPGKVLRGLIRLNVPGADVRVHNVSDLRSLGRTVAALR